MGLSTVIGRQCLMPLYGLSLKDAAKALTISESCLRSICRAHEIKRWPMRKLQVIEGHIHNLQVNGATGLPIPASYPEVMYALSSPVALLPHSSAQPSFTAPVRSMREEEGDESSAVVASDVTRSGPEAVLTMHRLARIFLINDPNLSLTEVNKHAQEIVSCVLAGRPLRPALIETLEICASHVSFDNGGAQVGDYSAAMSAAALAAVTPRGHASGSMMDGPPMLSEITSGPPSVTSSPASSISSAASSSSWPISPISSWAPASTPGTYDPSSNIYFAPQSIADVSQAALQHMYPHGLLNMDVARAAAVAAATAATSGAGYPPSGYYMPQPPPNRGLNVRQLAVLAQRKQAQRPRFDFVAGGSVKKQHSPQSAAPLPPMDPATMQYMNFPPMNPELEEHMRKRAKIEYQHQTHVPMYMPPQFDQASSSASAMPFSMNQVPYVYPIEYSSAIAGSAPHPMPSSSEMILSVQGIKRERSEFESPGEAAGSADPSDHTDQGASLLAPKPRHSIAEMMMEPDFSQFGQHHLISGSSGSEDRPPSSSASSYSTPFSSGTPIWSCKAELSPPSSGSFSFQSPSDFLIPETSPNSGLTDSILSA